MALACAGCGTGSTSSTPEPEPEPTPTSFTVGGTVTGLSGTVVLQNNLADDNSIAADGTFTFVTALDDAAAYSVTVLTQPSGQICTVSTGSGTIASANVTDVAVACVTPPPTNSDSQIASAAVTTALAIAANEGYSRGIGAIVLQGNPSLSKAVVGPTNFTTTCSAEEQNCNEFCSLSGQAVIAGTITADATESGGTITVSDINSPFTVTFTDCMGITKEIDGVPTDFDTTTILNGVVDMTLSGSASITDGGEGEVTLSLSGTMAGTVTVTLTGDIEGTVVVDHTTYSTVVEDVDTCGGYSDVTIASTAQTCFVATDCSGCTN